jgi:hypothetical protein
LAFFSSNSNILKILKSSKNLPQKIPLKIGFLIKKILKMIPRIRWTSYLSSNNTTYNNNNNRSSQRLFHKNNFRKKQRQQSSADLFNFMLMNAANSRQSPATLPLVFFNQNKIRI